MSEGILGNDKPEVRLGGPAPHVGERLLLRPLGPVEEVEADRATGSPALEREHHQRLALGGVGPGDRLKVCYGVAHDGGRNRVPSLSSRACWVASHCCTA